MPLLPMGTTLARRYVLTGPVGRGGVSTIFSAIDALDGRPLAVKVLAPALADDRRARENLRREGLITDLLRHPNVPRVFDQGDTPLPDGALLPYLVLELLTGEPLDGRLAGGPLAWPEAVRIAATAADVLAVAHRRGVVHRDLTAQNVMVTPTGIKIIDFGLAALVRTGSPGGRPVRAADDVYALGVLLYQMVTGRSPYPGGMPDTFLAPGHLRRPAPAPVLAVPGLPSRVAELCRACMSNQPDSRPGSVEVALGLWSVLDGRDAGADPAAYEEPTGAAAARSSWTSTASRIELIGVTTA